MGKEIETLKEKHNVFVLTFISQTFDEKLAQKHKDDQMWQAVKISKLTRILHIALEPWMPAYFAARSSIRFSLKLIKIVKKYNIEVIHAEYAAMGQYLWIKKFFPQIKFNLVEHDMTAQSYERKIEYAPNFVLRKYYEYQYNRIIKYEGRYCKQADNIFTLNNKDKRLFKKYYGRDDVIVLNTYCGIEDDVINAALDENKKEEDTICFLGQMGRPENDRAARRLIKICSVVKKKIPKLKLWIVGNNPSKELKTEAEKANSQVFDCLNSIDKASNTEKWIKITGFVEDVDDYLRRAEIAVFPLDTGAGIKSKVLRSMAMGLPVITGIVGAEGIDEDGVVIMLAETDEEYIEKIIELLENDNTRNNRKMESKKYIISNFSWSKSKEILDEIY